ncbi:MAG: hypothetical protein LBB77_11910 [Treponema sp.]|jgi:hypothetical protein|nr:hypothetical protein [Treponema sp.]
MNPPEPNESPCLGCFRLKSMDCPLSAQGRTRGYAGGRGQKVPRKVLFFQGAAVLLPPALGFAAGFALTGLFFPRSGEGSRAAAGLILMFLSAFGVYLFRRCSPAESS